VSVPPCARCCYQTAAGNSHPGICEEAAVGVREDPGVGLNIGSTLPDTVELHEVPNVKYRYVVVDNRTVVVDPDTHKIIKIIN
jgi:hypothetical protein